MDLDLEKISLSLVQISILKWGKVLQSLFNSSSRFCPNSQKDFNSIPFKHLFPSRTSVNKTKKSNKSSPTSRNLWQQKTCRLITFLEISKVKSKKNWSKKSYKTKNNWPKTQSTRRITIQNQIQTVKIKTKITLTKNWGKSKKLLAWTKVNRLTRF